MGFIYIFTFPNSKQYIGQTINKIKERYRNHRNGSEREVDKAIKEFGWVNIDRYEIECPKEFLDEIEDTWIKNFNTLFPNGYNMMGGGNKNRYVSNETKRKLSFIRKGKTFTDERKKKQSEVITDWWKNRETVIVSKETREKMSKAGKGRKVSNETRKRLSESKKLYWNKKKN